MKARISMLSAVAWVTGASFLAPAGAFASAPTIDRQWVTGVTAGNATLRAEINPNGLLTKYKLQIDTTGNFRFFQTDSCPLHPPGIGCAQVIVPGDPLAPGLVQPPEFTLAASTEPQQVSLNLASIGAILQPATTYHYRAIAANSNGFTYGPAQTFTTSPAIAPPTIDNEWVSDITEDSATLHADINPNGLLTMYELQLDTTGNFSFFQTSSCPLNVPGVGCATEIVPGDPLAPGLVQPPEFSLPAGYGSQHVSVNLASIGASLQPGTTYHYRAIAANGVPLVTGPDITFTTLSAEPPPDEQPEEELGEGDESEGDDRPEEGDEPPGQSPDPTVGADSFDDDRSQANTALEGALQASTKPACPDAARRWRMRAKAHMNHAHRIHGPGLLERRPAQRRKCGRIEQK